METPKVFNPLAFIPHKGLRAFVSAFIVMLVVQILTGDVGVSIGIAFVWGKLSHLDYTLNESDIGTAKHPYPSIHAQGG